MIKGNKKNYNYIVLNDKHLFKNLEIPSGATNFILYYKKDNPSEWGITIKNNMNDEQNQHVWKIKWYNLNGKLVPTHESECLTNSNIENELYKVLNDIIDNTTSKKKNKLN